MNVYQKLNEARNAFHSLKLEKTGHNKFAGYKYFELGDFLIPALKVFSDAGLCAVVCFTREEASLRIHCIENPTDSITIISPMGSAALKGCHEVQNIGAVETYQRRYLWVAALEIVEHDALDSSEPLKENKHAPVKAALAGVPVNEEDQAYLQELADSLIEDFESDSNAIKVCDKIGAAKLDADQKLLLWSILQPNSKLRSAIKAEEKFRHDARQKEIADAKNPDLSGAM